MIQTRSGSDDELRKDLADQITIELVRHAVAEEVAVYPEVKRKVSEGARPGKAGSAGVPR